MFWAEENAKKNTLLAKTYSNCSSFTSFTTYKDMFGTVCY